MHVSTHSPEFNLLLVEDSEDDVLLLMRELRKGGYRPHCHSVQQLAQVQQALGEQPWSLVICDYNLPGFTALDVLAVVRRYDADLPVIVVSGVCGEETAVATMRAGADDFIVKDKLSRLNPAVERELRYLAQNRERRRAAEALRGSEARFRQLAETIEEVFWMVECASGRMSYVSPAYEKVWLQPAAPLRERADAFLETVHPDDFEGVRRTLEVHGWAGFNLEYRIQCPEGTVRWVNTRSFPIHEGERLVRVAGLSIDVTERKLLETDKRMLARALEQTADAVMIANAHGEIEYVNAAFETITGYRKVEVLGANPKLLKSGFQDDRFYAQVWRRLRAGLPFTDIFINRRKNGELYYEEQTITPVRDGDGEITHFVSTGKDITRRLQAEERMQRILHYDALTGLANRVLFVERLNQALLQASNVQLMIGVCWVALDLSELLNGDHGQALEEKLLPVVARRLKEGVRVNDTVARLERDQFAVLLKYVHSREELECIAQGLLEAFRVPVRSDGYELYISPSIGISIYPGDAQRTDELMSRAEIAMEQARSDARVGYSFFSADSMGNGRLPGN